MTEVHGGLGVVSRESRAHRRFDDDESTVEPTIRNTTAGKCLDGYIPDDGTTGVVVTGAGGYIGGAIVAYLLEHTSVPRVHATVRGDVNSPRYALLRALDQNAEDATTTPATNASATNLSATSKPRLYLFSAEMTVPGAFDAACAGCSAFVHVAAPTTVRCRAKDAYAKMVDPAIKGVENVISSVERMGLKTVVYTSSMAAIQGDAWERGREHVSTERDWNELDETPKVNPYACMKVLSERRLWELYETRGSRASSSTLSAPQPSWEQLVVLCPGFVLGAPSTDVRSELVEFMILLMKGKVWPLVPNYCFSMVHLKDVARAHVLAAIGGALDGEIVANTATENETSIRRRYIVASGDRTVGLKGMLCGPVKAGLVGRLEERLGKRDGGYGRYVSWYRWPIGPAPKWLLWILSWFMMGVEWPLVRAYLNKPSRFDGEALVRELAGFEGFRDPVDGFLELLVWVVERGLDAS